MLSLLLLLAAIDVPPPPTVNDALTPPPERWAVFRHGNAAVAYDAARTPRRPPSGTVAFATLLWNAPASNAPFRWGEVIFRVNCAERTIGMSEGSRYDAAGRLLGRDSAGPNFRAAPPPASGPLAIAYRGVCGGAQPRPLFTAPSLEAAVARLNRQGLR